MVKERYELAVGRIKEMEKEQTVAESYQDYFWQMSAFVIMIEELKSCIDSGEYRRLPLADLEAWNERLYEDILPGRYENSYANPSYAVKTLGQYGQMLSFLYTELRGAIVYAFEKKTEYLDILFELLIEVYNRFEEEREPDIRGIRDILYWYACDYCEVFGAEHIREQIDPEGNFAAEIIENSDLSDIRYLYFFGEFVSDNERKTAQHLAELPPETIRRMADVYTEGYRVGFVNTGKDLSRKSTVNIRYALGFERVVRESVGNFRKMGLAPTFYRSGVSVLTKRRHLKLGYFGATANKQYEYDHKDDQAIFLDKQFLERRMEVLKTTYEKYKALAAGVAGPACMDVFGEKPFSPEQKKECVKLSEKQEELSLSYDSRAGQVTNMYIPGDERSYTIIAWPLPEIGEKYEEIFDEVIRINTLDAGVYEKVQQTIIDVLDAGEYVHILGGNGNKTDLKVRLYRLEDPDRQTVFENCVADVNIPVGEVFTSPVLEGTAGVLHVSCVYLNELQYKDLEITFANGMIADYTCRNFERELENKEYIRDNILHKHETLPLGEFAIGTNTTAYAAAKKYGIEKKLPILIAEKMGPHFAVGDTCYSWSEDVKVYNPNGKEIVARDNSVSIRRKEDVSKAYYHCHTDITIPYEELKCIAVVRKDGKRTDILRDGKFVLPGTEILNEPLKEVADEPS